MSTSLKAAKLAAKINKERSQHCDAVAVDGVAVKVEITSRMQEHLVFITFDADAKAGDCLELLDVVLRFYLLEGN